MQSSHEALVSMVDAALSVEKVRVRNQVRLAHLRNQGRDDPNTEGLLEQCQLLEDWVDGKVADLLKEHSAYHWFSRVKGVGKENIAKVVGLVDIEKAPTASSLWKFAGFAPIFKCLYCDVSESSEAALVAHIESQHPLEEIIAKAVAMRPTKGQKLPYNARLRTMCWRLATSLMRAKGAYYVVYLNYKEYLIARYERDGIKIVPSADLTKVNNKFVETQGTISEGHIHNMALRKMIKLFLSHLWVVWREAEGLPVRGPYVVEKLPGHSHIVDPWDMVEKTKAKASK